MLENCFGNLRDGCSLSIRNRDSDLGTEKRGLKVTDPPPFYQNFGDEKHYQNKKLRAGSNF